MIKPVAVALILLNMSLFAARQQPQERPPVAVVVVLDRSGSMAGIKMDLAKEAAKAPLDALS
jgi:uncharacterized protein with von Willebrand factor type A (vWA) domain